MMSDFVNKKWFKNLCGIFYWIISLTWGGLTTIPGLIITAFCIVFLHGKPHRNGWSYIVEVGGNWGGLELGAVSLCGTYYGRPFFDEVRYHEFGHSLFPQNLLMGPFFILLVGIPSACRYWYSRIREHNGWIEPEGWYERFWAEKYADIIGARVCKWIES